MLRKSFLAAALVLAAASPALGASELEECLSVKAGRAELVSFRPLGSLEGAAKLEGALVRPPGEGPFPAVVLLHRIFGVEAPDCYEYEQEQYRRWGYVSLLVDSNSLPRAARSGRFHTPTGYGYIEQAADARAAGSFLATLPEIDESRIAVVGHAFGGSAVLRGISVRSQERETSVRHKSIRGVFSAAVAWHPSCPPEPGETDVPTLVLIGGRDGVNSATACAALGKSSAEVSYLRVRVFSRAGHNFDAAWFTEYDRNTTKQAYEVVRSFLW